MKLLIYIIFWVTVHNFCKTALKKAVLKVQKCTHSCQTQWRTLDVICSLLKSIFSRLDSVPGSVLLVQELFGIKLGSS